MSLFRRTEPKPPRMEAPPSAPGPSEDDVRFQLREAERTVSALEGDLERARAELGEARRRSQGTDELADAIGQPLAHLATQVALVEGGSGELGATDLAATAAALLRALAAADIRAEGEIGAATAFDPNRHRAIHGAPEAGDPVAIRSPAVVAPSGRVVRHATVEPAP